MKPATLRPAPLFIARSSASVAALRTDLDTEAVARSHIEVRHDVRPSDTEEVEREYERMRKQLEQEDPRGTRPIGFQIDSESDGT